MEPQDATKTSPIKLCKNFNITLDVLTIIIVNYKSVANVVTPESPFQFRNEQQRDGCQLKKPAERAQGKNSREQQG